MKPEIRTEYDGFHYVGDGKYRRSATKDDYENVSDNPWKGSITSESDCAELCKGHPNCVAFSWEQGDLDCNLQINGPYTTHGDRTGKSSADCYKGKAKSTCTKKYNKKWPHCENIKCVNSDLASMKSSCENDKNCNGFSYNVHGGCLKKNCKNDGNNGMGRGSHDYYECQKGMIEEEFADYFSDTWTEEELTNLFSDSLEYFKGGMSKAKNWSSKMATDVKNWGSEAKSNVYNKVRNFFTSAKTPTEELIEDSAETMRNIVKDLVN